jgi:hypothetical protein
MGSTPADPVQKARGNKRAGLPGAYKRAHPAPRWQTPPEQRPIWSGASWEAFTASYPPPWTGTGIT